MQVTGVDHIVLTVADVERTVAWYHDELGLEVERMEQWRAGEVLFPSLRISDSSIIDVLAGDRSGQNVDHVALVVEGVDLDALAASGRFEVVAGPADLWGARGQGRGLYVHDPDDNVIELRSYDPPG